MTASCFLRSGKRPLTPTFGTRSITPAVDDLVKRRFKAESPNELWLTDITEFSAADGKLYLSPVIDCFDGKVVSRAVSDSPDNSLVERMIDEGIATLRDEGRRPIVHTDRGGHYRGGMWIEKLEGQRMRRSMSRKGNSGDNAACEGFFGRMKTGDALRHPTGNRSRPERSDRELSGLLQRGENQGLARRPFHQGAS
ncbi:DDE-type integrase/transposase/recombinase [uncultured Slackia sp.]|uniref:DDE-type integrase/transposase/recombinase n=1 Tax=uncultured Slackia sp. TaxID=665903 RepID=UPI003458C055